MARAVRRQQTASQRIVTLFGAALLVLIIVGALALVIQGSTRVMTESPMQRVISAPVAQYFFVSDFATMVDGTVIIEGHFAGVPDDMPETEEEWHELAVRVAKEYAKALSGVAEAVEVSYYHEGTLMDRVVEPVK